MTIDHDQVHAFADGELEPAEAEAFQLHLAECSRCQAELGEILQLQALGEAVAEEEPAPAPVPAPSRDRTFRPAWARRRLLTAALSGLALSAAVAVAVLRLGPGHHAANQPVLLAVAETRGLEARLSHPGARDYRPYAVQRSGGPAPTEPVPLSVLAKLEEARDLHGLGVGHLLRGERDEAAAELARAEATADVRSDRAVVALSQGQLEDALTLLDGVLKENPQHPEALWNRALVLRELGLPLSAAAAFDAVATQNEPGWAAEARQRAEALRKEVQAAGQRWLDAVRAGNALALSGTPLTAETVRALPAMARNYLYIALWAAPSAERVKALRPLAAELDARYGGDGLQRYVDRVAARDFHKRAPLAAEFAKIVAGRFDARETDAFLDRLAASGDTDILLGAIPKLHQLPQRLALYEKTAHSLGDAWFITNAELERATVDFGEGKPAEAERRLVGALALARSAHADFREANIEAALAYVLAIEQRLVEGRDHALAALRLGQSLNEEGLVDNALDRLGDLSRFRNAFSLTRAYLGEEALRRPESCDVQAYFHESLAMLHVFALEAKAARAEMATIGTCSEQRTMVGAHVLGDLVRLAPEPGDLEELQKLLGFIRAHHTLRPSQLAMTDHIEGLALLHRDAPAGRKLLRKAIDEVGKLPPEDVTGQKVRAYSYSALILDAGRAHDYAGALALFAEEAASTPPSRCALAVELHDEQFLAITRGPAGQLEGVYEGARTHPDFEVTTLIPETLQRTLEGCASVDVFARYPIHGQAGLLPPRFAWSYHTAAGESPISHAAPRALVVADVDAPRELGLPRLRTWDLSRNVPARFELTGAQATPERVLAELQDATEVELHAHGLVNLGVSDASYLALSPDASGRYALTAGEVRKQHFRGAPVVLLAACRAAQTAPYMHEPWSLPVAFIAAGARAVIASPVDIPDAEAGPFFEGVFARVRAGEPAARAVQAERAPLLAKDPRSWVKDVVVYQ